MLADEAGPYAGCPRQPLPGRCRRRSLSSASSHCTASAASRNVRMRNRPTRRSGRGSGTPLSTRTAARVPARGASWARKKFTIQPTKVLVGRAAPRRSMRSRRSGGNAGESRMASITSSHSVNVYGSMSVSSALGRPGETDHVTGIYQKNRKKAARAPSGRSREITRAFAAVGWLTAPY